MMSIAVAAMAFTGCSTDPDVAPEVQPILLELTAGSTTRTEIGPDNKITWSDTGETLKILERVDNTTTSALDNNGYTKDPSTSKASFTVSLPAKTGTTFNYATIHPKGAYVASSNTDLSAIKFIVPDLQVPGTTSYDPDADILVSKTITTDAQPTSLSLQFARIIALGKLQLTNLAIKSGETVSDLTFTAPDKAVTGRGKFNFETGKILTDQWGYSGQSKDNVALMYDDVAATATFDAWFTCMPFSVAANETFSVQVVTSRGTYARTVTIPAAGGLNFTLGDLTIFTVDMSSADFTPAVADPSIFTITFGATHPNVSNKRVDYSPNLDLGVTGSSASELSFDFSVPKEAIRSSNEFTGYDGASGAFGWWSAANTTMTINNINLNGKTNFALTFGAGAGSTTIQATISKDGTHFFPLSQTAVAVDAKTTGAELLKTVNFNLNAAITEPVSIRLENMGATGCKLDDIKLMPLDTPTSDSYLVDWKAAPGLITTPDNGGSLSFASDNGSGAAPESQTIEYAWEGDDCTFAFEKAGEDTWYTVTNTDAGNGTGTLTIQPEVYAATDVDRTGTVTVSVAKNNTTVITHKITVVQTPQGASVTAGKSYTLQPSSSLKWSAWDTALSYSNMSWTAKGDNVSAKAQPGNWDNNQRGQQFGTSTNKITTMSISGSGYSSYCSSETACGINSIDVSACAKSGSKITISVTVGGVSMTSTNATNTVSGSNASAVVTSNFTSDTFLTGDIVITYNLPTPGALYVNKIQIN